MTVTVPKKHIEKKNNLGFELIYFVSELQE